MLLEKQSGSIINCNNFTLNRNFKNYLLLSVSDMQYKFYCIKHLYYFIAFPPSYKQRIKMLININLLKV